MPDANVWLLLAAPLAFFAFVLYRSVQHFSGLGGQRRAPLPRLLWLIALGGLLYVAWLLMQE